MPFVGPRACSMLKSGSPLSEERGENAFYFAHRDGNLISVLIPTYMERENIVCLIESINKSLSRQAFEVVIIDDNSPDGTAEEVRRLSKKYGNIKLLIRPEKMGIGSAYKDGFKVASGDFVITMDADLSHNPEDIRRLLKELNRADIAIGSRYVAGGRVVGWNWYRRLLSWGANRLVRLVLGLNVEDATSGFRAYRRRVFEEIAKRSELSEFDFQIEALYLAKRLGFKVAEVPITFTGRERGRSKLSVKEIARFAGAILKIRFGLNELAREKEMWNSSTSQGTRMRANLRMREVPPHYYDDALRMPIYRHYHINRFRKVCRFINNANGPLLDVGCDGGLFTACLNKCCKPSYVVGLDISRKAVDYAKKMRPQMDFVVADGNLLPFRASSFKIITFLEVLEHVKRPELMLNEAKRVLDRGGAIVCLVPNEGSLLFRVVWFLWTKLRGKIWRDKHVTKFNERILVKKLKDAGFRVVSLTKINLGMLILAKATSA